MKRNIKSLGVLTGVLYILYNRNLGNLKSQLDKSIGTTVFNNKIHNVLDQLNSEVYSLVEEALPSVVNIRTEITGIERNSMLEMFGEQGTIKKSSSLGSGFIYKHNGDGKNKDKLYVITNYHVIENSDNIFVYDGLEEINITAFLIDKHSDIAILQSSQISKKYSKYLEFEEDLSNEKIGHMAIAIGNPFGFPDTVTKGIISYKNRSLPNSPYINYIQTDASINKGNSGGPLINSKGKVIGINNQIWSRGGGSNGVGYCIQSNEAYKIIKKLIDGEKITWGYLGVQVQQLTSEHYRIYSKRNGVIITKVFPNTPAHKAKLNEKSHSLPETGLIISYNGKNINTFFDLKKNVVRTKPGTVVKIKILKIFEKEALEFSVKIQELENQSIPLTIIETLESTDTDKNSVRINSSTMIKVLGSAQDDVVVILENDRSKELDNFDEIIYVGDKRITDINTLIKTLKDYRKLGKYIMSFLVKRRPKNRSSYREIVLVDIDVRGS
jgi:serine protease Do